MREGMLYTAHMEARGLLCPSLAFPTSFCHLCLRKVSCALPQHAINPSLPVAGRPAWHVRWGLQVPSRADMSARSTCTSWTQPHTLWRLSGQGGGSKTKSNRVSGRHKWHKRVKARERRTKRRTDTIGTRDEGCQVACGECKACRKTKAGLGLRRMERVRKG